jgi:hypothetical protein
MFIDGLDVFCAFRDWLRLYQSPTSSTPELEQTIAHFETEKKKRKITRTYLQVSKMAAAVGFGAEFKHISPLTG